jgi:hypothetical protein
MVFFLICRSLVRIRAWVLMPKWERYSQVLGGSITGSVTNSALSRHVVGEVRGGEALDMFQAMNTGTTGHCLPHKPTS